MPDPSLLQRLKERKLVQWALAYLAGVWAIMEASGYVGEQFGWPVVIGQAIVVVAVFGFFITIVLAWYHGEKGRQRVSGPELLMVAALLVIAGTGISLLRGGDEVSEPTEMVASPLAEEGRPGIAVLPCTNMSPDPADEYLAASLHDEILLKLQGISSLFSIGRSSVEWYRDNPAPLTQVAQELGVGFVGECSVQKHGEQIRLIFQLLDGRTGGQVWADDYDRDLTIGNLFDIQSDIAQQIAHAMRAVLTPEEHARIEATPTENLEAYDYYLLGRNYVARWTAEAMEQAIDYFRRAVEVDSTYAQGYAGLAYAIANLTAWGGVHPKEGWPDAREAAEKALTMDEGLAEAHTALAIEAMSHRHDWQAAEGGFGRALELDPSRVDALVWYGCLLGGIWGRFDEANALLERARGLDPRSRDVRFNVGVLLTWAGRYDEAARTYEDLTGSDPDFFPAWVGLAEMFVAQGRYEEALETLQPAMVLASPTYDAPIGTLGFLYGRLGQPDDALKQLERIDELAASGRYVSPVTRAMVYAGLDEVDSAFVWLERGYEERTHWLIWLGRTPYLWGDLPSDQRFTDLLRRMNLSD